MTGIFMYQCINGNTPKVFDNFSQRNNTVQVHGHNTRQADDDLCVPYARLDILKTCLKVDSVSTIECRYSAVQHNMILHMVRQ